jgi:hypothetical protein
MRHLEESWHRGRCYTGAPLLQPDEKKEEEEEEDGLSSAYN